MKTKAAKTKKLQKSKKNLQNKTFYEQRNFVDEFIVLQCISAVKIIKIELALKLKKLIN